MGYNITSRLVKIHLYSLLIFLLILISLFNTSFAKQIDIKIEDLEENQISEILEGQSFKVSVYDINNIYSPYLIDYTIRFNNKIYEITDETENRELVLNAPMVDNNKNFIITATNGTNFNSQTITVKDFKIYIESMSGKIIDEGKMFSIKITDGINPIENVDVRIQNVQNSDKSDDITDKDGIAILKAPKNKDEITIYADYNNEKSFIKLTIQQEPTFFENLINNNLTPLLIALIILFLMIIYVHLKQKKPIYTKNQIETDEIKKEINPVLDKKENKKFDFENNSSTLEDKIVRVNSDKDTKVEEIRISRPKKEKKVVPIDTNEDKTNKILLEKKDQLNKNYQDWFAGKDDIKYEINKLTGEIDEDGLDKWFEGVDNLKEKINEKVKKEKKKEENT